MNDKIFNTNILDVGIELDVTADMINEDDVIMVIPRDPVNRSDKNITYNIERGLLDMAGYKGFVHKAFSICFKGGRTLTEFFNFQVVLVVFTPDKMIVARGGVTK